ncbi:MAG TPA: hypothetical protein PLW01_09550 [Agitococcus sp.]|uniref:hypothetical protein n=1 Tax=uncultured Agitococcus sp. TaxID=1506599 RepID=UPI00262178A4|nr:hypothetical protein [uncultured Agitococcus sp.]HRH92148.1 hypothetical protein [Agitococcus sp.]
MSQITLYLDDEAEQLLRQSAQAAGLSNSKWIAELIKKHARQEWPKELKNLAGSFADFPLRENKLQHAEDTPRVGF